VCARLVVPGDGEPELEIKGRLAALTEDPLFPHRSLSGPLIVAEERQREPSTSCRLNRFEIVHVVEGHSNDHLEILKYSQTSEPVSSLEIRGRLARSVIRSIVPVIRRRR
jgi:hypothetical protein